MNENYPQPSLPAGAEDDIVRGLYRLTAGENAKVRLIGSGTILREVMAAADLLRGDWQIACDVYSATSFSELARDARDVERANRLGAAKRTSHVAAMLAGDAPIVAATDYVRAYPELIAAHVEARFIALGTDGFGRSDTRKALRRFFEVDRHSIAIAALHALDDARVSDAIRRYEIAATPPPWTR
jgi:pyruvate dehydrogenase E1 component